MESRPVEVHVLNLRTNRVTGDWLARHLIDSGWDVKNLWRQIVTSATYRQASEASPELQARDPENVLLDRGAVPAARRDVRDNAHDQRLLSGVPWLPSKTLEARGHDHKYDPITQPSMPDRAVRDGLPNADLGPGSNQPGGRARAYLRALRPRLAEAGNFRGQMPAGQAWPSATSGSSQLYHPGWDHHGGLPVSIRYLCRETDQACAGLIQDLKQRGMLEDT